MPKFWVIILSFEFLHWVLSFFPLSFFLDGQKSSLIYHRLDSCKIPSNHNRILCRYRTAMLCIFLISLFNMTHWPTYTHCAIRGLLLFLVSGQLIGQSEHVTFFNINHHDLFFPCVEHFSSIQQSSIKKDFWQIILIQLNVKGRDCV